MKYIQNENTEALIVTLIVFLIISFFIVKWDIHETKQCEIEGEYRDFVSKVRLRAVIIMLLIGIFSILKELYKRY